MSASVAERAREAEVSGLGVGGEDHVSGTVEDAVVRVGSEVVEELAKVGIG